MRSLDRYTIETLGVPGDVLMECAGRAVTDVLMDRIGATGGLAGSAEVCVVCGTGNNGGDGLVIARHLHQLGVRVRVALLGAGSALRGDAATNLARAQALGLAIEGPEWRLPSSGAVVDAIFGTGLSRAVEGQARDSIERINQARDSGLAVVSVDLPSGLDADTGQILGAAVRAHVTVTIGLPKLGLVLEPGRSHAGELRVARIGIADSLPDSPVAAELWSPRQAGGRLPARFASGHKGSFGHLLLVAGSEGKTGAAALAAAGAGRAGAGLVTIACPAGLNDILEIKCTEAMTAPVADTERRSLAAAAEDSILALAASRDVVAAGPGIGRDSETQVLMHALAKRLECPLVLDADGVVAFSGELGRLKGRSAPTILTPHPGEAAQLLESSATEINRDRVGAARELAAQTGAVVLLKGAATVTADPGGSLVVNPTGGPSLATGGTGDVLTGMVAAYLGQGLNPLEAAALAAYVHGAASERLAREIGSSGLLAGDLATEVPATAEALRRMASAIPEGGTAGGGEGSGSSLTLAFPGA
jgi:NAD(P)H-hydrate epimerase